MNEGQMTLDEYRRRAEPRLAAIDALAAKINFDSFSWQSTQEGERYQRLMREQGAASLNRAPGAVHTPSPLTPSVPAR